MCTFAVVWFALYLTFRSLKLTFFPTAFFLSHLANTSPLYTYMAFPVYWWQDIKTKKQWQHSSRNSWTVPPLLATLLLFISSTECSGDISEESNYLLKSIAKYPLILVRAELGPMSVLHFCWEILILKSNLNTGMIHKGVMQGPEGRIFPLYTPPGHWMKTQSNFTSVAAAWQPYKYLHLLPFPSLYLTLRVNKSPLRTAARNLLR